MAGNQNTRKFLNESIIREINKAVESLEYGEVVVKVHNRKIIQIEVVQKRRFDDVWKIEEGGGI